MTRKSKVVDALSPLDAITTIVAGVLLTFLAVGTLATIVDSDTTIFGMDRKEICVERNFSLTDDTDMVKEMREAQGIRDGKTLNTTMTNVCDPHPAFTTVLLTGLRQIPTAIVFISFLLLIRRTITYARRHGLFSPGLAAKVERLGWLLLIGLIAAALIEWLADGFLLQNFLSTASWASGSFSVSVPGIIGAYGLVSIGRIMSRAAALQADADATI